MATTTPPSPPAPPKQTSPSPPPPGETPASSAPTPDAVTHNPDRLSNDATFPYALYYAVGFKEGDRLALYTRCHLLKPLHLDADQMVPQDGFLLKTEADMEKYCGQFTDIKCNGPRGWFGLFVENDYAKFPFDVSRHSEELVGFRDYRIGTLKELQFTHYFRHFGHNFCEDEVIVSVTVTQGTSPNTHMLMLESFVFRCSCFISFATDKVDLKQPLTPIILRNSLCRYFAVGRTNSNHVVLVYDLETEELLVPLVEELQANNLVVVVPRRDCERQRRERALREAGRVVAGWHFGTDSICVSIHFDESVYNSGLKSTVHGYLCDVYQESFVDLNGAFTPEQRRELAAKRRPHRDLSPKFLVTILNEPTRYVVLLDQEPEDPVVTVTEGHMDGFLKSSVPDRKELAVSAGSYSSPKAVLRTLLEGIQLLLGPEKTRVGWMLFVSDDSRAACVFADICKEAGFPFVFSRPWKYVKVGARLVAAAGARALAERENVAFVEVRETSLACQTFRRAFNNFYDADSANYTLDRNKTNTANSFFAHVVSMSKTCKTFLFCFEGVSKSTQDSFLAMFVSPHPFDLVPEVESVELAAVKMTKLLHGRGTPRMELYTEEMSNYSFNLHYTSMKAGFDNEIAAFCRSAEDYEGVEARFCRSFYFRLREEIPFVPDLDTIDPKTIAPAPEAASGNKSPRIGVATGTVPPSFICRPNDTRTV